MRSMVSFNGNLSLDHRENHNQKKHVILCYFLVHFLNYHHDKYRYNLSQSLDHMIEMSLVIHLQLTTEF
jgi:hypothetical protein